MTNKLQKKILLIGGSGFVGSFLIKELQDHIVENLDKNSSPFFDNLTVNGDIRNLDEIKIPKDTDCVVLLAAEHRDDVSPTSLYYDVNVQGTKNVLQAMDNSGIKNIIFTSSVAIYGLNKSNPDENHPQDPFNHYGKSKWEAELVIRDWFEKDPKNKSINIIRPTVIFGERNRGNVFNLLKQISSGNFMIIGKGENKKSMAYVGNIVSFIKNRLEVNESGYHIFNYADKPDYSMSELTQIIQKKMGIKPSNIKIPFWIGMLGGYFFDLISLVLQKKLRVSSVRVNKFCATTQFDASKVRSVFKSPYTLEEGLNKTLEHEFINKQVDDILFYSE